MRDALEAVGQGRNSHDPTRRSESPVSSLESPSFPGFEGFPTLAANQPFEEVDPNALTLPPYRVANTIFRWYWQNFHSVFPFLHWPTFKERCLATWNQKQPPVQSFEQVLFYATVNMVMAVACLRNETQTPDHREYDPDVFYKRSLRLVSIEAIDGASIPILHLMLLRAMYLYFAGRADRCWLMSGAAVRVAVGLGLHLPSKRQLSQLEREMRRRVWFGGCVALDQYGLPTPGVSPPCNLLTGLIGLSPTALAGPALFSPALLKHPSHFASMKSTFLRLKKPHSQKGFHPAWI